MCKFKKKQSVIEQFNRSLLIDYEDMGVDFIEANIDNVINNPVFEAIPIVKCFKGIIKGCLAIRDRYLLKNICVFLKNLRDGNLTQKQINDYKNKNLKNKKQYDKEIERVIFLIDRQSEEQKVIMISNYFKSLINEEITYNTFVDYTDLVDKLLWTDLSYIKNIWENRITRDWMIFDKDDDKKVLNRLSGFGIGELRFTNIDDKSWLSKLHKNTFYYYDEYSRNFINIGFWGKFTNRKRDKKEINNG